MCATFINPVIVTCKIMSTVYVILSNYIIIIITTSHVCICVCPVLFDSVSFEEKSPSYYDNHNSLYTILLSVQ